MAEETVVKEPLRPEMEAAGKELTRRLDASGLELVASFWFFVSESSEWRLILATPMVDQAGPKAAYSAVQEALKSEPEQVGGLSLRNISVVSPTLPIVQLLRSAIKTEPTAIGSIRFTRSRINNVLIEDALIYRSA